MTSNGTRSGLAFAYMMLPLRLPNSRDISHSSQRVRTSFLVSQPRSTYLLTCFGMAPLLGAMAVRLATSTDLTLLTLPWLLFSSILDSVISSSLSISRLYSHSQWTSLDKVADSVGKNTKQLGCSFSIVYSVRYVVPFFLANLTRFYVWPTLH